MSYNMCCRICGNEKHNKIYWIRERQINKGDKFQYLYCSQCGTLQLNESIVNLGQYYPEDYYSFHMVDSGRGKVIPISVKRWLAKLIVNDRFRAFDILQDMLREKMSSLMKLYGTKINFNSKILDVGGGNGKWLHRISQYGYHNLTCIDLFCKSSPFNSVNFFQCDIRELDEKEKYDLITFHHSFEHMEEPEEILNKVKRLLNENGLCLIRIPVCECEAWNQYQEDWYQIDAPRHYYLYTERALRILCKRANLQVFKIIYDSGLEQLTISEYYKNTDFSLKEIRQLKNKQIRKNRKIRKQLNKNGRGDQAAFYIGHPFMIK